MNLKYITWVATALSIFGAFAVANGLFTAGYIAFISGCIGWGYSGYIAKDNALITMQMFFLVANIMGLYNAI